MRLVSSARSRSSLAGDTERPTRTVSRIPWRMAAVATAMPWLPLLAVTRAASGRSSATTATLLCAPRVLNAPVGCTSSRLRRTSAAPVASDSSRLGSSGV